MNATHPSKLTLRRNTLWTPTSEGKPGDRRSGRRRTLSKHASMFLPGQPVLESGIYEVIHDKNHREAHEAVMYRSDLFPVCDQCELRVRFRLIRSAPYIFDDEDFAKD
jgi:hypothetical protein